MTDLRLDRRGFLKRLGQAGIGLGVMGLSLESRLFMEQAHGVTPTGAHYDACLQIFFPGGPSQTDTFDPKPGSRNNVFSPINLGVKDVYNEDFLVTDLLSGLANLVQSDPDVGLGAIRSMTHGDNNHQEARETMFNYWTGNLVGSYPTMASVMAHYGQGHPFGVPSVVIEDGLGRRGVTLEANQAKASGCPLALQVNTGGPGGSPIVDALSLPACADRARYDRRKALLDVIQRRFVSERPYVVNKAWERATEEAHQITVKGDAARAFDLTGVPLVPSSSASVSQRLTLAGRLIESGIPYVLAGIGGNDTHQSNRETHQRIWGEDIDRGLLEVINRIKVTGKRVLILLGGEFGRTPNTVASGRNGRDHWGDGFSWAMVSVNQPLFQSTAIGQTGPNGVLRARSGDLVDPVLPKDLGGFVYRALGYQVGDVPGVFNVPMEARTAPPVDRNNTSDTLLRTFGLL
jgi:Protein of unknown function (DUF1501)